jgi:competence protein ComFC
MADALLDLLFPPCCVGCQQGGDWLCARCLSAAEVITPPLCTRCGMPHDAEAARCALPATSPLNGLLACAFHTGPVREAIHQLKYADLQRLAVPLGKWMAERWSLLAPGGWAADIVVPVPLHPRRERRRGYNQSALLAREFGASIGLPVVTDVLVRARATRPQVGLPAQERAVNVRDAFACTANSLTGKRVLLVDDVCTTGNTLTAACQALCAAGASSVWAYCLARARTPSRTV